MTLPIASIRYRRRAVSPAPQGSALSCDPWSCRSRSSTSPAGWRRASPFQHLDVGAHRGGRHLPQPIRKAAAVSQHQHLCRRRDRRWRALLPMRHGVGCRCGCPWWETVCKMRAVSRSGPAFPWSNIEPRTVAIACSTSSGQVVVGVQNSRPRERSLFLFLVGQTRFWGWRGCRQRRVNVMIMDLTPSLRAARSVAKRPRMQVFSEPIVAAQEVIAPTTGRHPRACPP